MLYVFTVGRGSDGSVYNVLRGLRFLGGETNSRTRRVPISLGRIRSHGANTQRRRAAVEGRISEYPRDGA